MTSILFVKTLVTLIFVAVVVLGKKLSRLRKMGLVLVMLSTAIVGTIDRDFSKTWPTIVWFLLMAISIALVFVAWHQEKKARLASREIS
jgi:drug/metabolite transporter (DMT)-like permease